MATDYKIEKLEKGPLQRFKNQNLLLKKFGEVGLQVYKVITGKRTSEELRKDLDMDEEKFSGILRYMEEAGMVKLSRVGGGKEEAAPEEEFAPEAPPEEEEEKAPPAMKKKRPAPSEEEAPAEEEIAPEITPEFEEEAPKKKKPPAKRAPAPEEEALPEEEIVPEITPEEEGRPLPKKKRPAPAEEEAPPEEEAPKEEISFGAEEVPEKEEEGSPVEKIIRDKYGDIGVQVYTLIDGQRTAEEIMEETGLNEAKLVEILDFLDEQGIIKLEYPKGKGGAEAAAAEEKPKEMAEEFAPMIEGEEEVDRAAVKEVSPDLAPAKAAVPITKSVQVRAKTMLRYGDTGDKVLSAIDGKADVIDIALKLNAPMPRVMEILDFIRDEGGAILAPVPRPEVRRKYGEDGFSIYKRYGKEGLMLYELIGKEMSIKEMAERVTKDKAKVVDMFLFIYEVLGIEMPVNKDALMKQLGL